jgi:hypothetical protein
MTVDEITKMAAEVMTSGISQKGARFVLPEPMLVELANRIAAQARQREWVGLTDEERLEVASRKWWHWEDAFDIGGFARAIEQALKEKNT